MPPRFDLLTRLADDRVFVPVPQADLLPTHRLTDHGGRDVEIKSARFTSYGRQRGVEIRATHPLVHPLVELQSDTTTSIHLQRHVTGSALTNLRDAGAYVGYRGLLPPGTLFRSENLAKLEDHDIELLRLLGIRTIIDLRDDRECTSAPTPPGVSAFAEIIRLPMTGRILGHDDAIVAIAEGLIHEIQIADMTDMYAHLLDTYRSHFLAAAETILTRSEGSVLVHCTAGKDRTGLVVALTHLALGVPEHDLIEDFALSNLYRTPVRLGELTPRIAEWGAQPRQVWPYLSAPVTSLVAMLPRLTELAKELTV